MPIRKRNAGSDHNQKGSRKGNRPESPDSRTYKIGNIRSLKVCHSCYNTLQKKLLKRRQLDADFKQQLSECN